MMKRRFLFLLLMLATMSATMSAYDFEVDGIYYSKLSGSEVKVTCKDNSFNSYQGDIVIPDTVSYQDQTYLVTMIGLNAFRKCSNPLTVVIPNSVTIIDDMSFFYCEGLTSITFGDSITRIGGSSFSSCSNLEAVSIPNSVTYIGGGAFSGCRNLVTVNIPNLVTAIEPSTFYACNKLDHVIIPNSVETIGDGAFQGCYVISSIEIPSSVTSIGDNAFSGDIGLTDVTIHNPAISIGASAFHYCSGLTSVTIGNTRMTNSSLMGRIGDKAFQYCKALTSITFGDAIGSIGASAFEQCTALAQAIIPNSVKTIGKRAFHDCTGLTQLSIGNHVDTICELAFYGCKGLTNIVIPASVTQIQYQAFDGCTGLESIQVERNNTAYDSRNNCNAIIETVSNTLIQGCNNSIIPNYVEAIASRAFANCDGLTSIELPSTLASIRYYAFYGCVNLNSITVAADNPVFDSRDNCNAIIETGSNSLFLGCKNTVIPESVTSIGDFAFASCNQLDSIEIPNSVDSIGYSAFYSCNLVKIICHAITPPVLSSSFSDYNATLYVPYESIQLYRDDEFWGSFAVIKPCDVEETHAPIIYYEDHYTDCVMISIENSSEDPDAEIYFRFGENELCLTEWLQYSGPIAFGDLGGHYLLEAFAVSEGKAESEHVSFYFIVDYLPAPTFVTPPIVYAHHVDNEKGLAIRIVDGLFGDKNYRDYEYVQNGDCYYEFYNDYSMGYYYDPAYKYLKPEHYYYKFNDSDEWTEYDGEIYLDQYGEYEIITKTTNGDQYYEVSATVVYDSTGFMSQSDHTIVKDGLVYYTNDDGDASVAGYYFEHYYYFLSFPIISPERSGDIVIPATIHINNSDYTVERIGANALAGFTSVTIPSTVTSFEVNYGDGHDGYPGLVSLAVDEDNQVYDSRDNCNAVIETASNTLILGCQNTIIPSSVTVIGPRAFFGCAYLTSITIPASVTAIDDGAFYYTVGLDRVLCYPVTPPSVCECSFDVFADASDNRTILFVPNESLEAYRAHQEWGKFTHIVPFIGAGPGDVNGDGSISVGDATNLIDELLSGGDLPAWMDVNGDGNVSIGDVTALIDRLLAGGL